MRVYYDNCVASGLVVSDLSQAEMLALSEIEAAHQCGIIKRVTSRESWREQERTRNAVRRSQLEDARDLVSVVQADHRVIQWENLEGLSGTTAANPIVSDIVDESIFADVTALGLKSADAKHFMYAATNNCQRFVTLDPDFLNRRSLLEKRCPSLRVVKPSELAEELRLAANQEQD
jgi:predicted nucleic acid-binding protein